MTPSHLFDLAGMSLLALFAFSVWPPAALAVVGVALLLASWKASR